METAARKIRAAAAGRKAFFDTLGSPDRPLDGPGCFANIEKGFFDEIVYFARIALAIQKRAW